MCGALFELLCPLVAKLINAGLNSSPILIHLSNECEQAPRTSSKQQERSALCGVLFLRINQFDLTHSRSLLLPTWVMEPPYDYVYDCFSAARQVCSCRATKLHFSVTQLMITSWLRFIHSFNLFHPHCTQLHLFSYSQPSLRSFYFSWVIINDLKFLIVMKSSFIKFICDSVCFLLKGINGTQICPSSLPADFSDHNLAPRLR